MIYAHLEHVQISCKINIKIQQPVILLIESINPLVHVRRSFKKGSRLETVARFELIKYM